LATLLLAACGGRYSQTVESEGASGTSSTSGTGHEAPRGGSGSAAGGASAGTGMSLGGAPVGVGGTASAGTGGGGHEELADYKTCNFYCSAYAMTCADAALPELCTQDCIAHLGSQSIDCRSAKRGLFVCVSQVLSQYPTSCVRGFAAVSQQCERERQELAGCGELPCEQSISGDATGCRAVVACPDGIRSLYCRETGDGSTPCSCTVNGNPAFDVVTSFASSKQACSDEQLLTECRSTLDPGL
jgi:hypothetical protein